MLTISALMHISTDLFCSTRSFNLVWGLDASRDGHLTDKNLFDYFFLLSVDVVNKSANVQYVLNLGDYFAFII